MSYLLGDVLVDKQNSDIFALGGELVECSFDGRVLGLRVHNQEVLLAIRWLRDVLKCALGYVPWNNMNIREPYAYACKEHARDGVLGLVSTAAAPGV
jgi:hypothetical protein